MKTTCFKCTETNTTILIFNDDNDKPTEFCIKHIEDAHKMYKENKIKYKDSKWAKNVELIFGGDNDE